MLTGRLPLCQVVSICPLEATSCSTSNWPRSEDDTSTPPTSAQYVTMCLREPFCQLCGVNFNLARIRRIDEPLSLETAWDRKRPPWPPLDESDVKTRPYIRVKKKSKPHPACMAAGCSDADGDHAAGGPGCGIEDGYNGWRITPQEMNMITRVQCLTPKRPQGGRRGPDGDGLDFELENEDWCVTAVSRGSAGPSCALKVPYIKGIGGKVRICNFDGGWRSSTGFHASCFQVYKRVCTQKKGEVLLDCILKARDLSRSVSAICFNQCLWFFCFCFRFVVYYG